MLEGIQVPDQVLTVLRSSDLTVEMQMAKEALLFLGATSVQHHDTPDGILYRFQENVQLGMEEILKAKAMGATPVNVQLNKISYNSSGVGKKSTGLTAIKVWCSVPDSKKTTNPQILEGEETWEDLANTSGGVSKDNRIYWLMEPLLGAPDYFTMQRENPVEVSEAPN